MVLNRPLLLFLIDKVSMCGVYSSSGPLILSGAVCKEKEIFLFLYSELGSVQSIMYSRKQLDSLGGIVLYLIKYDFNNIK